MTSVPIPTFVPQDAWFGLTLGNANPSIADSVATAAMLSPSGGQDGLIGSLDGGVVFLAGTAAELDGGQKWLMWTAASLAVADGVNVFNPYVVTGTPGRWLTASAAQRLVGGQIITAGATVAVIAANVSVVNVLVNKTVGSPTTLLLPPAAAQQQWQEYLIKDGKRDADVNPITLDGNGLTIDGAGTLVIAVAGGSVSLVWNGTEYNQK